MKKEGRTSRFPLMLTDEERETWEALAAKAGETLSAWVRRAVRKEVERERRKDNA